MSEKPEPKNSRKDKSANSSSSTRAGNTSPTQDVSEIEISATPKVVINPTIISSQEVKVLRTLCYDNILACEEFIRASNLTTQNALPINTWIPETNQFLIEQKLISLEIPNHDTWKMLPYIEGLFPILKQIYPANTKTGSAATPIEKVVDLKPFFSHINVWKEQTLNTCVTKMREISNSLRLQMFNLFVTVGTTDFDDLIEVCDTSDFVELIFSLRVKQLVMQIGRGKFEPRFLTKACADVGISLEVFRFKSNLDYEVREADLILSHCGAGSILEAITLRKMLIVVINESLQDNHQIELSNALVAGGFCSSAIPRTLITKLREFIEKLQTTSDKAFQEAPTFPINDSFAFPKIAESLFNFQDD